MHERILARNIVAGRIKPHVVAAHCLHQPGNRAGCVWVERQLDWIVHQHSGSQGTAGAHKSLIGQMPKARPIAIVRAGDAPLHLILRNDQPN